MTDECAANPEAFLWVDHPLDWESRNGEIPNVACVLARTGWASRFSGAKACKKSGEDGMSHIPGISKEAAEFLTRKRDSWEWVLKPLAPTPVCPELSTHFSPTTTSCMGLGAWA